jgi:hypothetical protein
MFTLLIVKVPKTITYYRNISLLCSKTELDCISPLIQELLLLPVDHQ